MSSVDQLLLAWRREPGLETTLALCAAVHGPEHEHVARELFEHVKVRLVGDSRVLLATGRMLVRCELQAEAQTALALAGKADAADWRPFLELGRLLLLRGDAVRGAQALRRAHRLGCDLEELDAWIAMADELAPLQGSAGAQSVAEEVAQRALPWPDDGTAFSIGDLAVSQSSPTDPPPPDEVPLAAPRAPAPPGAVERTSPVAPRAAPALPLGSAAVTLELSAVPAAPGSGRAPRVIVSGAPRAEGASLALLERADAADLGWEQPRSTAATGARVLWVATLLSAALIAGAYVFGWQVRATRAARALELGTSVERRQTSGRSDELRASERELAQLFALAPDSPRVAELWLENRVLATLEYPEPPTGLADAVVRAEALELSPAQRATGRLALHFASGDVVGAAALVPTLDGLGEGSGLYHLVAGAVLEARGDPQAVERYRRAAELSPALVSAQVHLVRLSLLERGTRPGRSAAPLGVRSLDAHPVGRTLQGLQWAVDPARERVPPQVPLTPAELLELPPWLRAVPHLVAAVQATGRGERERAVEDLEAGLAAAQTPATITRFGLMALQAGAPHLARRAAMRVARAAPHYPPLAALDARLALLDGTLEAAELAASSVAATRRDLAAVHVVTAYELADLDGVRVALGALDGAPKEDPELGAVALMLAVARGAEAPEPERLQDLAVPRVLWGELLAVDSALDSGKLDLARTIVRGWGPQVQDLPPFAVRAARVLRYAGEPARADGFARRGFVATDPTPRAVVELVHAHLARQEGAEAARLVEAYRARLGSYAAWLNVLVVAQTENIPEARVLASRLAVPSDTAALALRVLAVRALVETGEARGRNALYAMVAAHGAHPELVAARALIEK